MAKYIKERSDRFSIVDTVTGESVPYVQTRKYDPKEFIMVFLAESRPLMELTGNILKVLICCWEYSTYNPTKEEDGNILFNGSGFKEACRNNGLNISGAAIDNAISTLCKKGLLIKIHRGEYQLNPRHFYKGRLANRDKVKIHPSMIEEQNE